MGKGRYLLKRLIYIVFVFFIISILMFFIYKAMPGDPVTMMLGDAKNNMRPDDYLELYNRTRAQLGLDKPLVVQYLIWIGNMLTGDFGYSTQYKQQVIQVIGAPMMNTLMLNALSMVVVFVIAIPLGIATAVHKNTFFDKFVQVITIVGYSLPALSSRCCSSSPLRSKSRSSRSAASAAPASPAPAPPMCWIRCGTWRCPSSSWPSRASAASPAMSAPR